MTLMHISISGDIGRATDPLALLSHKRWSRAVNTAVNETGRQTLTMAARLVSKEAGLKARITKKQFTVRKSRPATLTAHVVASGSPIQLIEFGARQTKRGVSAKAWGKRKTYPGTFIATMASGKRGVFVRKGAARLPIRPLYGPGVPGTLAQEKITRATKEFAGQRLRSNIARQMDRAIRKMKGFAG